MELGRPPPVWYSAVAYGETQVLNSNSTSAVQDPPSRLGVEQTPQGLPTGGSALKGGLDRPPEIYGIQSTSGQYVSYWNAFLFFVTVT